MKMRGFNERLSPRTLIVVAAISLIGISINAFLLGANITNKPKASSYSGCVDATLHSDGIVEEADLSCTMKYQGALDTWGRVNYTYGIFVVLLISILFADVFIANHKIRKNRRSKH